MPDTNVRATSAQTLDWLAHLPRAHLLIALLIIAQIVVWTFVPYLSGISLPLDVVSDGLAWGHEWQWGYYKHPPLPSWEVEASFDAFGDVGPYLLSQITVSLTYAFVFLLGCELMEAKWAAAGTALAACIYYFSIPTPEFNHNVAQMPLWPAIIYAYWKATHGCGYRCWVTLGMGAGVALLTKYASVVLLILVAVHLLASTERRALLRTAGPYLALGTCFVVFSPHLYWLYQNHFPTVSYVALRAGQETGLVRSVAAPLRFLLSQLVDISPAFAAAAIAGLMGPRLLPRAADEKLRFLAFFGVGPAILTALLSLLARLGLRDMWGAPMWSLTGLLIVYASRDGWPRASIARLGAAVAISFVLFPVAFVLATNTVPAMRGKPSRTQWPDQALAKTFDEAWFRKTGRPLHIVAADGWLGGLVAMRSPQRPSVFTDGDFRKAPWVTPERLRSEGALVVWRGDKPVPSDLSRLQNVKVVGRITFTWPVNTAAKPLVLGWGTILPNQLQK